MGRCPAKGQDPWIERRPKGLVGEEGSNRNGGIPRVAQGLWIVIKLLVDNFAAWRATLCRGPFLRGNVWRTCYKKGRN